jgi:hypothetical protein
MRRRTFRPTSVSSPSRLHSSSERKPEIQSQRTHHSPSAATPSARSTVLRIMSVSSCSPPVGTSANTAARKRRAVRHIIQCSGIDAGGVAMRTPTRARQLHSGVDGAGGAHQACARHDARTHAPAAAQAPRAQWDSPRHLAAPKAIH